MPHVVVKSRFAIVRGLLWVVLCTSASGQRAEAELERYFKKWLEEDVVYLMTDEERAVFQKLKVPEEKEQFIEQFWRRRDPTPETLTNEFKEEHYRRVAYANDAFRSGVPGWKTDRGRIYIKFGPPDEIERHPAGGPYVRPSHEGGGTTSTFPFEVWSYRHLEGVGESVEIEFVDPTQSGEYRLARDPLEKDALLYLPNAGMTLAEAAGGQSRADRIRFRNIGDPSGYTPEGKPITPELFQFLRLQDFGLERLQRLFNLGKPPQIKFPDLKQVVTSRISYQTLPFEFRSDFFQISSDAALAPVTLRIPHKYLTYRELSPGQLEARVNVYGQVESIRGEVVYVFEELIASRAQREKWEEEQRKASIYQKRLPLKPGRYKLHLVLKDVHGDQMSTLETLLLIPPQEAEALSSSSIVLADRIVPAKVEETLADPFIFSGFKVYPNVTHQFERDQKYLRAFLEIYNVALDSSTLQPRVKAEYTVARKDESPVLRGEVSSEIQFLNDRLVIFKAVPLEGLPAAEYVLRFRLTDLITDRILEPSASFLVR